MCIRTSTRIIAAATLAVGLSATPSLPTLGSTWSVLTIRSAHAEPGSNPGNPPPKPVDPPANPPPRDTSCTSCGCPGKPACKPGPSGKEK